MPEPFILFEHQTRQFEWTPQRTDAIEQLRSAMKGVDVLRIAKQGREDCLQSFQYVGVARLADTTIEIWPKMCRPKIGGKENDEPTKEQKETATRNLLYLLSYSDDFGIKEHDLAALSQYDSNWFEVLTYLFATHLLEEWQRGAHRTYQTVEDELPVLRGKLRVAEQLRHPARLHIFSVVYDEFTTDNRLNQVFRLVVERLWHLTRVAQNRRLLGDLRMMMDEVTLCTSITAAETKPERLLTRLNQRFAPLLNLARIFLNQSTLQLTSGNLDTYAFVFDMNKVFEQFVVNFITRHQAEILPVEWQDYNLRPQTSGLTLHLAQAAGKSVFRLEPDLAFQNKAAKFPLLLDAKYKLLKPDKDDYAVSSEDFYQMYAYAHRYCCPHVLMIYPQTVDMLDALYRRFNLEDFEVENQKGTIVAATIDLRKKLAYNNEQDLICTFKKLLEGATQ